MVTLWDQAWAGGGEGGANRSGIEIVQFGWAKGEEKSRKKRSDTCVSLQDFVSNGQNLEHYAEAKANQRKKKMEGDLTEMTKKEKSWSLICKEMRK